MSYKVLAKYYDSLMTDFDYNAYTEFILKNINGHNGLDLACGSGEMTVRLSKKGFKMVGVDKSTEMLTVATQKAKSMFQNIMFLDADLNNLKISKKYDFIISVCDGFNYVSTYENLKKSFSVIYNALNESGKFIFDISSEHKLKHILGNNLFYEDNENLTYLWQNNLSENSVEMALTFFENQGDYYTRYDECQTQFIYSNRQVLELLNMIGFKTKAFDEKFKEMQNSDSQNLRLVVVATK